MRWMDRAMEIIGESQGDKNQGGGGLRPVRAAILGNGGCGVGRCLHRLQAVSPKAGKLDRGGRGFPA